MASINITNSRGFVVSTINVATTSGAAFPIEIQGQGILPYGAIYGDTVFHLLENFANTTEPTNPVEGMDFYNSSLSVPHFYNGSKFIPYLTAATGASGLFTMLPAATNLDLTTVATIPIFTAPNDGTTFHPTSIILIPKTVTDVTGPAQIRLEITSNEDVMENVLVDNVSVDKHHQYNISGTTRFAKNAESIIFGVSGGATGGVALVLTVDVFLFGWNKQ